MEDEHAIDNLPSERDGSEVQEIGVSPTASASLMSKRKIIRCHSHESSLVLGSDCRGQHR
jgi:hypothetical protein